MQFINNSYRFHNALKATVLIAFTFFGMTSCKDDEDEVVIPDHVVQFFASAQIFSENDDEQVVKLTLDKPAAISGIVKISFTTDHTDRFTTTPEAANGIITLPITKNQSNIEFKINPTNNTKVDGDEKVTFTLTEASDGFILGTTKVNEITIEDDEEAVKANFLFAIASVRENRGEGFEAIIFFSGFTESEGSITVAFQSSSAIYGTDFITEPAAVNGKIQLPVASESDYVFIKFIPVNNQLITGDRDIKFTLQSAEGGVAIGETSVMDLTILDDESFSLSKIDDVRNLYTDEPIILDNMHVVAVVTSAGDNVGQTTTFIEDETGGIAIRLIFAHNFQRGDKLNIDLDYGLLTETKGVLEVQQISAAEKIGTAQVEHAMMTLEELHASQEDLEGKLVHLYDLTFTEADGTKTMQGDRIISDGTHTAIVRTLNHASFKDQLVPTGDMAVKGILTEVNGNFIIYPQIFAEDVVPEN